MIRSVSRDAHRLQPDTRNAIKESMRTLGAKVEEFKRTIKRFLAENSPKSGLHARQDPSMPVPFLSFEGLRNRLANNTPSAADPGTLDYGATSHQGFDELESTGVTISAIQRNLHLIWLYSLTDGSDDEAPRHYQLQPLRKEAPIYKSPELIENDESPSQPQPQSPKDTEALVQDEGPKSEEHLPQELPVGNEAPKEKQRVPGETRSATTPSTPGLSPEDQELSYYVNLVFPVLHELAGFNLSAKELMTVSKREPTIRSALVAQAKHHQNRMRFLTSTDGPHHQTTQKLCLDLAASNNVYVSALGGLNSVFEKATRENDIDTLAVLYTLLHFGGIGELLTRHIARRGNQSSGGGFLLELSCRWLASSIARYADLASALRRGSDRQRAVIQAAINIDIYSSIALCRPPHFLDSYRASFRNGDISTAVDSNGARMAVPRLDDLMDIPAKTLLALAEMSAMASWKAEHLRHGTLSVMDLSRWAKRVDALLAPPSPELLLGSISLKPTVKTHPVANKAAPQPVAGPSEFASAAQLQVNTEPTPVSMSLIFPTISNLPAPVNPVKSEGESVKAGSTTVPVALTEQITAGTLPPSTPVTETIDQAMTDSVADTCTAPKPPASERPVVPRATPNQMPRLPYRRILPPATREVFRCAGRVFLHTILSGEHPRVHDIVQAVGDTCGALRDLGLSYLPPGSRPSQTDDLRFPVVRGLPFCIFIAGCMAGNMEQGMFLRSCLRPVIREIDMQASELLTTVLGERAGSGDATSWQSVMVKRGARLVFM
ncbi:Fungal specific transcription factor domain [Rhizoctonia solani]|uniref:Fungal specific transcription factor domain n=1 Tax=Rhizoctonia solani TaxID=456999 RepID=A0A8H7H9G9_9AGAM|nr:Fungal specific transcription factor domain [Rhizoctonia solani]